MEALSAENVDDKWNRNNAQDRRSRRRAIKVIAKTSRKRIAGRINAMKRANLEQWAKDLETTQAAAGTAAFAMLNEKFDAGHGVSSVLKGEEIITDTNRILREVENAERSNTSRPPPLDHPNPAWRQFEMQLPPSREVLAITWTDF